MANRSSPRTPQPGHPAIVARLGAREQDELLAELAGILAAAPFFRPTLPRWGTPFSVLMSNCGPLGWVSDKKGYRYQPGHPETGRPWPPMPPRLIELWARHTGYHAPPEACLINYYGPGARMGLHQDRDEHVAAPVLSVSLGDTARFRLGGLERNAPTASFELLSGDIMMLEGPTRLAFHGIDRTFPGTSDLLAACPGLFAQGGRLNLTLRRVTVPG